MQTIDASFLSDDLMLSGTLTIPVDQESLPCVIMVHGSGSQDRDGNMGGFKVQIFKFIAEFLAKKGIASLRYDKRGCGKSEGDFSVAGLSEMVADVSAAVDFISNYRGIDKSRILLLGHSEGAVLAPEICNKNPEISGVIMLCVSIRSFEEDGARNAEFLNRDFINLTGLKGVLARAFFYSKDPVKQMEEFKKENRICDSMLTQSLSPT